MVRLLSDALLKKSNKKQRADLDGGAALPPESRYKDWAFSSSDELLRNYKDSLCFSAAPKTKTVAKKKGKKEIQVGGRFGECKPG